MNYLNNISCAIRWKFIVKYCVTCVNPLPAHSEGSSGLNEVIGDGAAVVSAGAPRQLGCTVCHLLHRHWVWRAGRAWLNHKNRYCEVFAHAEAQTTLQNSIFARFARKTWHLVAYKGKAHTHTRRPKWYRYIAFISFNQHQRENILKKAFSWEDVMPFTKY